MLFRQSRRFERAAELLPFQRRLLRKPSLLSVRQAMDGGGQRTDRLLDAFIGRRQLEPRVEGFQVKAKFIAERERHRRLAGLPGHGDGMIRYERWA